MFHVVLVNPEIPPNTGNVIRMCANTGSRLHLVAPLGFELTDSHLRRAGLDYHDMTVVTVHDSWPALCDSLAQGRFLAFTTTARRWHTEHSFAADDVLVFGCESTGLPAPIVAGFAEERQVRIPMVPGSRSLNLSNSAALAVYEGWRQLGFPGGA